MFDVELNKKLPKPALYEEIFLLFKGIVTGEKDVLANLANTASLLFNCLPQVNWVGFYRVGEKELILGPFQGKPACIRIPFGQGVCGAAYTERKNKMVDDVNAFSGHIACDAASRSEIVLPLVLQGAVVAILDIDSPIVKRFDKEDEIGLSEIIDHLCGVLDTKSLFWSLP